jgi:polyhydroxyalkanoate synthesis regulator phasin
MDENMNMNEEERVTDQAKAWLQENLRVIVSFFIVAAIALGIYSYSQRADETIDSADDMTVATESETMDSIKTADVKANDQSKTVTTPKELSRETEGSFIETATKGDGTTHLARRALANYLEKTPDSSLTGEHKVYVEDYLRKQLKERGSLAVGQSAEFSKDMIRQAIDHSKQLNGKQLQNLKKYSSRVAAYRS